jgi:hypothetical protein
MEVSTALKHHCFMKFFLWSFALLISISTFAQKSRKSTSSVYYPGKEWEKKKPATVGMDSALAFFWSRTVWGGDRTTERPGRSVRHHH